MTRPGPDQALVGQLLDGRYRIEAMLGHGGMGAVYRATHVHMGQRVAIKVLRPHLAGDAVAARRFAREAKGTFQLDTEHAVKVIDFGATEDGLVYMVMEHLDGRTVSDELEVDGPLAPARAVRVAAAMCDALAAAHRLGFVHRDIKPDNVMLVRRGQDPDFVKVLDFGLAKLIEGAGGAPFSVAALTQKDMVFGTPEYMAPEQAMGQQLDGRADLYAVGATLFEMLTGRPPFVDDSPMRLLAAHVKASPPTLREAAAWLDAPPALDAVIARCLAKDPARRPSSAEELAASLRTLAPALATRAARVPAAVATSETIDVDAADVRAAAAVPRGPAAVAASTAPPAPARLAPASTAGTAVVSTHGMRRSTRVTIVSIAVAVAAAGVVAALAFARDRRVPSSSASGSTSIPATGPEEAASSGIDAQPTAITTLPEVPGTSGGADAAVAASPGIDAGPPADAAPTSRPPRDREPAREVDPALARHVAAAEAARRAGNRLRQLAEADAALRIDGRHVRAKFLVGEALLETGDVANGCKYLRAARRLADARALLGAGRCPAD